MRVPLALSGPASSPLKNNRGHLPMPPRVKKLLPDPKPVDQLAVTGRILGLQIIEQPPPLPDQLEQAAPRVVVFLVRFEMLGEVVDALGQERHLHLGGAGVSLVRPELLHHAGFLALVMQRPLRHLLIPCVFRPLLRRPGGRASRRWFWYLRLPAF